MQAPVAAQLYADQASKKRRVCDGPKRGSELTVGVRHESSATVDMAKTKTFWRMVALIPACNVYSIPVLFKCQSSAPLSPKFCESVE